MPSELSSKRAQQVEHLFHCALEHAEPGRSAFLENACGRDVTLRREVESLLAQDQNAEHFIETPAIGVAARLLQLDAKRDKAVFATADTSSASYLGLVAGQVFCQRFRLVRKLGEGGMGRVWLADQTSPVRRQVALKLIRVGLYDEAAIERFRGERQSLAMMDHPVIAKVFDAGATEHGQPYFVMEYVPGLPITEYCDSKKLTVKQRLELFIPACEGAQHAHQKAIIHRDLKPENILVVEVDGKPVPRIIDFGLAKAVKVQTDSATLVTQMGTLVGTPAYMSPEQADPTATDIDTRTDVYSLGVVLYVLLTGALPIDMKQWHKQPLEVLRKLREEEPERPSTKVSADRQRASSTAGARGTGAPQLASLLRGDLDWITMKALEKDRARRYGTPSELAADIRRYLKHEPVIARPASTIYRTKKYVLRHRFTVATIASLVLLLAAFAFVQGRELQRIKGERDRANRERDRANHERDRATRVTDFMTNMFKVPDPNETRGNSVTAREILDKASRDVGNGLAKDPEVESEMMQVMARTYMNLGLYARAHELAKQAMDARLSLHGPDDPKTLESMTQLGWILSREGQDAEAEKLERAALAGETRMLGSEDALTLQTKDHLAVIREDEGFYADEEELEREVIEAATRALGPENDQTLLAMNSLGSALWKQGRYADAEQQYRQLLDIERRVWGPDHPQTLATMYNLALVIKSQGHFAEAEQQYREVLAAQVRVSGPEHPNTAIMMEGLAAVLSREGHLSQAEKLYREVFAMRMRTLGYKHPDTLLSEYDLGDVLFRESHIQEAESLQRRTLQAQVGTLGQDNPDTLASQSNLARTLIRAGRYAEAEKLARDAFEVQLRTLGPRNPDTLNTLQQLGTAMAYQHRYGEATELFHDVVVKQNSSKTQGNPFLVWYGFACVAAAAGRSDDAVRYLQEATHYGYRDAAGLMADQELKGLRHNPHFQELIKQLRDPSTAH
jgi:eukaryotic-like serine/threonine-protein kinase